MQNLTPICTRGLLLNSSNDSVTVQHRSKADSMLKQSTLVSPIPCSVFPFRQVYLAELQRLLHTRDNYPSYSPWIRVALSGTDNEGI